MPVCFNYDDHPCNALLSTHLNGTVQPWPGEKAIHVGIINNMPDAALHATERQFLRLLDSSSNGRMVRVSFYALPEVRRGEAGRLHISSFYSDAESLWDTNLDGVIITGAEPRAGRLVDESFWRHLTNVFDWAERNARSAIVSCLSAHAAVFHFDGIERQRYAEKRSGLFECRRMTDHFLTAGTPLKFRMPHSRWNGVSEADLLRNNYLVLTQSAQAGADIFIKQMKCLLICFQGHPEYESKTLLLEYHRDVGRFLRQQAAAPPSLPEGYFDSETARSLTRLRGEPLIDALLANAGPLCTDKPDRSIWFSVAQRIYANWLNFLARPNRTDIDVTGNRLANAQSAGACRTAGLTN